MNADPFLGVLLHWLGGLAAGSFYVPYRAVRRWSWETYWLVGGVFSWIVMPWAWASMLTENLLEVLLSQAPQTLWWTYFFGALWGGGGLTFGLTMRYLGMSLGMGVALGYCAAFGTLIPPLLKSFLPAVPVPETLTAIASSSPGQITLGGVGVCLLGIALAALAGLAKEREMPVAQKQAAIREFDFRKGVAMATFSGAMSACFAFALTAGNPIGDASLEAGTPALWSGLPKLVVVLAGGFTTNLLWCVVLHVRNRSGRQYFASVARPEHAQLRGGASEHAAASLISDDGMTQARRVPLFRNYLFSALAGTAWYFQFFFYTMGETQMGRFGFASWTLHMASIIIFSTLWGWILHEWRGASRKVLQLITAGILVLILSTVVIGLGTYLRSGETGSMGH